EGRTHVFILEVLTSVDKVLTPLSTDIGNGISRNTEGISTSVDSVDTFPPPIPVVGSPGLGVDDRGFSFVGRSMRYRGELWECFDQASEELYLAQNRGQPTEYSCTALVSEVTLLEVAS
ncbi:MAG: hypothetical protein AAGF24_06265, partial [Cyanobacteria bacterium P01_H01_bin.121]